MRTKKGNFGKVIGISNVTGRKTPKYLIKWTWEKAYYICQVKDVKHSKNIIDLIEKDDYVNGCRVYEVETKGITVYQKVEDGNINYNWFSKDEIETIVTKERFANMEYRLEV